jgi:hypothetical protein
MQQVAVVRCAKAFHPLVGVNRLDPPRHVPRRHRADR